MRLSVRLLKSIPNNYPTLTLLFFYLLLWFSNIFHLSFRTPSNTYATKQLRTIQGLWTPSVRKSKYFLQHFSHRLFQMKIIIPTHASCSLRSSWQPWTNFLLASEPARRSSNLKASCTRFCQISSSLTVFKTVVIPRFREDQPNSYQCFISFSCPAISRVEYVRFGTVFRQNPIKHVVVSPMTTYTGCPAVSSWISNTDTLYGLWCHPQCRCLPPKSSYDHS